MAPACTRVAFVSDVEGDLAFLERIVALSDVVGFRDDPGALPGTPGRLDFLEAAGDNAGFVFGGDLFDNGPGDIRLSKLMVDFKKRYPTRVHLLMGNRDINKLRFLEETDPGFGLCGPFWDGNAPDYKGVLAAAQAEREADGTLPSLGAVRDTFINRVQYMLTYTMGCPRTFEHRRAELAVLGRSTADADVARSFRDAVVPGHPDSYVLDYLLHADIAVVIGRTLFTHGSVPTDAYKYVLSAATKFMHVHGDQAQVPGERRPELTAEEWAAANNAAAAASLEEYIEAARRRSGREHHPAFWEYEQPFEALPSREDGGRDVLSDRPGAGLLAMQCRPATCDRNTVVNSWYDRGALTVPADVAQALLADGILRVCVGHKPCGDCPLVHTTAEGLQVVNADTQHSDPTAPDRRGAAVNAITLTATTADTSVNGVLICASRAAFCIPDKAHIGRRTQDGWWVRAWVPSTARYALVRQVKYDFHYKHATQDEVEALLAASPAAL